MSPRTPIIAVVGRPNVGKSTFFNRIAGKQIAVVEDVEGVTRDRNYAYVERFSIPFYLVDTGGFEKNPEEDLKKLVVQQTQVAIEEADSLIVVFDGNAGVQPGDHEIVEFLRPYQRNAFYAVNKCDGAEQALKVIDFYQLGLPELYDISALHGHRVKEFIEKVLGLLPAYQQLLESAKSKTEKKEKDEAEIKWEIERNTRALESLDETELEKNYCSETNSNTEAFPSACDQPPTFAPVFIPEKSSMTQDEYERSYRFRSISETTTMWIQEHEDEFPLSSSKNFEDLETEDNCEKDSLRECIKIAIVGRPNVGKSTLLNTLTGEERAITSAISGTTRDTIDLKIRRNGQDYLIVDTAGLRRKSRISDTVEKYSTLRTLRAISQCDVAVVVIDAACGPSEQDAKIAGIAHEAGRGVILAINKWDLIEKHHRSVEEFTEKTREALKFLAYAPLVFISAQTGKRCPRIIEIVKQVAAEQRKRISTRKLNETLRQALMTFSPPTYRGQSVKISFATQISSTPPKFVLFFNQPKGVNFSYLRFVKNVLHKEFGFQGTDIQLLVRKR